MNANQKAVERFMRSIRSLPDQAPEAKSASNDTASLQRDIANSFAEKLRRYTKAEIDAWLLWEKKDPKWEDMLRLSVDRQLNATSFYDLEAIARDNPERALERWEQVKAAARADLASGWQAGRGVTAEIVDDAWDQACYLAVREQFERLWPPRNGVESIVLDEMVQYEMYRRKTLKALWGIPPDGASDRSNKLLQSIDRIQRLFQESLRLLMTLRRSRSPVVVTNATALENAGDPEPSETTAA